MRSLLSSNYECVILDCVRIEGDYVYYRQCFENESKLWLNFPKTLLDSQINRQTIAPSYTSINNMRWGKPSVLKSYEAYKQEIVKHGFLPVWLPKTHNFDLDDRDDWVISEAVFKQIVQKKLINK